MQWTVSTNVLGFRELDQSFLHRKSWCLVRILGKIGYPPTFINLVKQQHTHMEVCLTFMGSFCSGQWDKGRWHSCTNTPFSISFAVFLSLAFVNYKSGISLRFRISGKVFYLRMFNAIWVPVLISAIWWRCRLCSALGSKICNS